MCGIIAYLGKNAGSKIALEGIHLLRNRGYDSVGCCSQNPKTRKLVITKYATINDENNGYNRLEQSYDRHEEATCLAMHTRWATTGRVSDENSHPHLDTLTNSIALVHNGIINNYLELKEFLQQHGVKFNSETDTEVIVNLISFYKQTSENLMDAIKKTLKELEGTWALVIIDQNDPDTLYICKKGSPILVGISDEMCIVSSESSGFSNYLRNYHKVMDDEIIKISLENNKIKFYIDDKLSELSTHNIIEQTLHAHTPDPFPHWTLKEIMEQPLAAFRALNQGGRILNSNQVNLGGLKNHKSSLMEIDHLTIIASGTSGFAALIGQKYFQEISGFDTVRYVEPSEFNLTHDIARNNAGILLLSQSGETRDVYKCMEKIRYDRPDVPIFSIINVVESLIAREADCGVYLNAGREVGVASTKSFTNQVVVLILMAIWFAQVRNLSPMIRSKMIQGLFNMQTTIEKTLKDMIIPSEKIVSYLLNQDHLFILGKGKGFHVAQEGALKIKELSYLHAEAYPSGSLKHGPLALITDGTPVILIRQGTSEILESIDIAAEEIKARGGYVSAITSQNSKIYDQQILVPHDITLGPILANIPLQYIAYSLSNKLGYNPDYPRNLAKCVTVE